MAMLPVFCDFVAGYFTLLCSSADARSFIFCSPRKWSKRCSQEHLRFSWESLPFADAYRYYFTPKIIISLTCILTAIGAQIAYGNISDTTFSLVTLHVYFSVFVCTAHSQTNSNLIYISHIARSNIGWAVSMAKCEAAEQNAGVLISKSICAYRVQRHAASLEYRRH